MVQTIYFYLKFVDRFTQEALDFLKDIIVIVVIVVVIRTFLVMPFQINGQSMYESYYNKEFILVDRLSHRDLPLIGELQDMERWDVIVFAPWVSKERKYFIKRIIGVPGETVKIESGKVYIKEVGADNFYELDEASYLSEENNKKTYVRWSEWSNIYQVPENMYFVLGDNRNHSTDSRTCFQTCSIRGNFVSPEEVTGRVLLDLWYFNFSSFSFIHPSLGISTIPKFFSSPSQYTY